ncbi:MAG: FKBP-type peptidyl-prolyl cis-trans isomerase [Thermodesulfobacteriota bacterium]
MTQAKSGDTVKIHYKGTLNDGTVFDSSEGRDPLEFTIGEGNIIPGVEEAVIGMAPEDTKTETISPDKAYGDYRSEMVIDVDKSQFPENIDPEVGQQLELKQQDGQTVVVTVTEVNENQVKLDANHPLAGKDLTFEIQLEEIQ